MYGDTSNFKYNFILWYVSECISFNTLRPRQNGRCFADNTFKCTFLQENVRISIKISLKFVPQGPINNNPALVQITALRRSGDKPLSEPMMVSLLTHICVIRPQWVNYMNHISLLQVWMSINTVIITFGNKGLFENLDPRTPFSESKTKKEHKNNKKHAIADFAVWLWSLLKSGCRVRRHRKCITTSKVEPKYHIERLN